MKVYSGVAVSSLLACALTAQYVIARRSPASVKQQDKGIVTETFSSSAGQGDAATMATVIRQEKAAFEALKNKDKKTYADLMADEMTVISADEGMLDKAATLKSFDSETLSTYSLNDVSGINVAPNVILLTYKLHIKTALAGKPHEGNFFVSSLWVNRGGVWKNILYPETPPT